MVQQGRSTADIDQTLVSQYGPTILLVPPSPGGIALIWILPIAFGAIALVIIGAVFVRRNRQFAELRADAAPLAAAGERSDDD